MSIRSPMAGAFVGTEDVLKSIVGLGRLSRLRPVSGESPQFFSMNLTTEA